MAHGGINVGNYFANQGLGGSSESANVGTSDLNNIRNIVGKLGDSLGLPSTAQSAAQSLGVRTPGSSAPTAPAASESVASTEVIKALASLGVQTSTINMVA